jgi:hypothetical protein
MRAPFFLSYGDNNVDGNGAFEGAMPTALKK